MVSHPDIVPGTGQIEAAVKKLRAVMDEASDKHRDENGLHSRSKEISSDVL